MIPNVLVIAVWIERLVTEAVSLYHAKLPQDWMVTLQIFVYYFVIKVI